MKRSTFLMILFFSFVTASEINAQEKKPTKEETMSWIAEKFKDVLLEPRKFVSYRDGIITYRNRESYIVKINLNNLSTYRAFAYGTLSDPSLELKGRNLVIFHDGTTDNSFLETNAVYRESPLGNTVFEGYDNVLGISQVDGLRERLYKALDALLEYNVGKKENEAF